MSNFGDHPAGFFGVSGFYNGVATQSVRGGAVNGSSFLSQTFSGGTSTGSGDTCTLSCWVKRNEPSNTGYNQYIFTAGAASDAFTLWFTAAADKLVFRRNNGAVTITTDRVFRDVSSWYNIVLRIKTSESSDDDKYQIWINGLRETVTRSGTPVTTFLGVNSQIHNVLKYPNGSSYGNVYLSDMNFVDGLALDASYFGEFKGGVWIAKNPDVSNYGTNGFRFKFDKTGLGTGSASTIGADSSGKNNHFDSSGIAAEDCNMPDSPENNFATLNPLHKGYASTPYSKGNLKIVGTGSAGAATYSTVASTMELTGKVYFEVYINALTGTGRNSVAIVGENYLMNKYGSVSTVGISGFDQAGDLAGVGTGDDDWNTAKGGNASTETTIGYTGGGSDTVADVGDIVQIAYDSATGYAWYGVIDRDNSDTQAWFNSGNPAGGSGYVGILDTAVKQFAGGIVQSSSDSLIFNFGQDSSFAGSVTAQGNTDSNGVGDFYGTVPSGFVASCSANLPELTIGPDSTTQASDHFNTVTYSGSSGAQTITTGLQPDWIWIKVTSLTGYHNLTDTSRGITKELYANTTDDEENIGRIESSSTTGFTFPSTEYGYTNENGQTFVSWNWHANGGTTTTNDASATSVGTIDSVYQANTTAGFSIVTYTGTGSNGTIAHGLGAVARMVIIKNRDQTDNWAVGHTDIGFSNHLQLNVTDASTSASAVFNSTAPTSTVFSVGTNHKTNASSEDYIAYCFAEVEGYSKFGSFTGNGSTDGTFVFTGFRPQLVIAKCTSHTSAWHMVDADVDYNPVGYLNANASDAYGDYAHYDLLSNGFKIRDNGTESNRSGGTFIYMAFAEAPFKYSNAH